MSELKPDPELADSVAKLLRLVSDAPCDLCAGDCRHHSLGDEWVPEEGSRAWAEDVLRRLVHTRPQPSAEPVEAGDGVQQCDRDAAQEFWNPDDYRTPYKDDIPSGAADDLDIVQAFARHRATAAAAERARIVAWLRKEADALTVEQADTRQGSPDWLCLREQVEDYQIIADAIERGEV